MNIHVKTILGSLAMSWALIQVGNNIAGRLPFHHERCVSVTGAAQAHASVVSRRGPPSLPLEDIYRDSYNEIEYLKVYLSHLADPITQQLFNNDMIYKVDEFQVRIAKEYTALFKDTFPHRAAELFGFTELQRERARENMTRLLQKLDAMNWNITSWADRTTFVNLSGIEIRESILATGEELWTRQFQSIKECVDRVLMQFSYQGQPLQYVGSLNNGTRGAHKGKTVININDFDADLFVVHPAEWQKHLPVISEEFPENVSNEKIYPLGTNMQELQNLSYAVGSALAGELKDKVKNAWKFSDNTEIVLREKDSYK